MKRPLGAFAVIAAFALVALSLMGGHAPRPGSGGSAGAGADPRIAPPPLPPRSARSAIRAQALVQPGGSVFASPGFACPPGRRVGQQIAIASAPRGTLVNTMVQSAAVGRSQRVLVYLPPGYGQQPLRRYPVLYLLHGFPGTPGNMSTTVGAPEYEDALLAAGRMQPTILVMPSGSSSVSYDTEWANGAAAQSAWETFVAHDVVGFVDHTYRTIARGTARGIAGLSAGGYGAINIALHHLGEFTVVESWSGYMQADPTVGAFAHSVS